MNHVVPSMYVFLFVYFVDEFTVKCTKNVAHAHYYPCDEYEAIFSPFRTSREWPGDEARYY